MYKKLLFLTGLVVLLSVVAAFETRNGTEETRTSHSESDLTERGRRKKLFYGLGGLWLGGFHALAAVIAIKFKIIIVGIFLFGAIFYGFRIWAGKGIGCPEPSIVKEPFYPHGITAYAHTSPDIYSSYPYSGHSSGLYYSHPTAGADVYAPPSPTADIPDEVLATGSHYKRKGRSVEEDQPRQTTSTKIDVAEIIFTFLNVNTMECKRRFVCEVDFLSRRDPWIRIGYSMFGQGLFGNYRTKESVNVKKYRECLKLFEGCRTPGEEEAYKVSYVETTSKNATRTAAMKKRRRVQRRS